MAELTITIASHHFKVSKMTVRGRPAVVSFVREYIHYEGRKNYRGVYVQEPKHTYASRLADFSEYRFHINQLEKFKAHLQHYYLNKEGLVEYIQLPVPEGMGAELVMQPGWAPKPEQVPALEYMVGEKPSMRKLLGIQTGKGKAQPLDAKIKIPGGWTTMGKVQPGDIITAADGTPTKVVSIHPQGVKDIYRITFVDGRSTECCAEHLWRVYRSSSPSHWKVVTTAELIEMRRYRPDRCFIELIEPEDGPELDLPIPPYVLGVLLGDAHLGNTSIVLTTPDAYIVDAVTAQLPEDLCITRRSEIEFAIVKKSGLFSQNGSRANGYVRRLHQLGLAGKLSHEKFIPEMYLRGSRAQRLALLQGLMDTDGTVNVSGSLSFCSSSQALAQSVEYLVRSLGGIAFITRKIKHFTYKGERKQGLPAYQVNIRHRKPSEFFQLPRKRDRVNDENQYSATLKLRIADIELIGQKPAQCISIDHPSRLYVTDDFIVTHNTFCAIYAAYLLQARAVYVLDPKYMEKWEEDFDKHYVLEREDILVINNAKALKSLLYLAAEGGLECKIIMMNSVIMQNWFKQYEKLGEESFALGFACRPDEFYELVGAQIRTIDEVHEAFHQKFKVDLYTNVKRTISLSASMVSDDTFLNRMYEMCYPSAERFKGEAYDRYVSATGVFYRFDRPDLIRDRERGGAGSSYSHHVFEDSILKSRETFANWMKLIRMCVQSEYIADYKPGSRMLVYASGIEMATAIRDDLRKWFTDLRIERYCGSIDDPYDNLMEADICVSTPGSAGTGHDIPWLRVALLTVAVNATQSNIQGFGRLRRLDKYTKEDVTPRFLWLINQDNKTHIGYHDKKMELLKERALVLNTRNYGTPL